MVFNSSITGQGSHREGRLPRERHQSHESSVSDLQLSRLAFFKSASIADRQLRIDFTTTLGGAIALDRPIRLFARNAMGKTVAQYTVENLNLLDEAVKVRLSNTIIKCRNSELSIKALAQNLLRLTEHDNRIQWSTESLYPGARKPLRELRPCTPSLTEFLKNPECLEKAFYSVRETAQTEEKLTAVMDTNAHTITFTLCAENTISRKPTEQKNQRMVVDCSPPNDESLTTNPQDILAPIVWQAMEAFWNNGAAGLTRYLFRTSEHEKSSRTSATQVRVQDFCFYGKSNAGAYISFEGSSQVAQVTLTQEPLSSPLSKKPTAGGGQWIFVNDQKATRAISSSTDNTMLKKIGAAVTTLLHSRGESSIEEAFTTLTRAARSEMFYRPDTSAVLELGVSDYVAKLPNTRVLHSWESPSISELINFLEGTTSLKLILAEDPTIPTRFPFNALTIDRFADDRVRLSFDNSLGVHCEAQFRHLSAEDMRLVLRTFDQQLEETTPSFNRRRLQLVLENLKNRNTGNWVLFTGHSSIPTTNDIDAHQLLDAALPVINRYLAMRTIREKTSFTEKSNTTVIYSKNGTIEVHLGEDYHPYQLRLTLQHNSLTRLEIIPSESSPGRLKKPRSYTSRNGITLNTSESERFFESTLKHFFSLVSNATRSSEFGNSELRRFLDRHFQDSQ
jgi:hypothetical protein